mmetsp:Transcript_29826/g.76987  ORF Transcript_29826/g.76987 Transcript_29826/m.76987 type:complete len:282 (-) Transcript_29826:300-1145(-)
MSRPEHIAPPEIFYDETESRKYAQSSRMMEIQMTMAERAVELLNLREDQEYMLLDVGCGTGMSGDAITELGHRFIGVDISENMLKMAVERETEGDVVCQDMGQGLPFRAGCFDGAISISAVQWLCNADKSGDVPRRRLMRFFNSLNFVLARGTRAVLQFYPENPDQMELITSSAMRAGFSGGLVVDYPNSSKAKKYFLVLYNGPPDPKYFQLPEGKGSEEEDGSVHKGKRERAGKKKKGKNEGPSFKSRKWIMDKKDRQRKQGKEVRNDTKFTGRKRKPRF